MSVWCSGVRRLLEPREARLHRGEDPLVARDLDLVVAGVAQPVDRPEPGEPARIAACDRGSRDIPERLHERALADQQVMQRTHEAAPPWRRMVLAAMQVAPTACGFAPRAGDCADGSAECVRSAGAGRRE